MELVSLLVNEIPETVLSTRQVVVGRESFSKFSTLLEELLPLLDQIIKNKWDVDDINTVVDVLNQQVKLAKTLARDYCGTCSKIYRLVNCRRILKPKLESITKEIGSALSLISLMEDVGTKMMLFEFETSLAEEAVLKKIDVGIQERNFTRSYANNLLMLIAEAVGISKDPLELKRELDDFENEVASARKSMKDLAEAIHMDQIVLLLAKADATLSFKDKEIIYRRRRESLGNHMLEPLQSFYCPITGEIMEDPVEISSGQTFERRAIEKWINESNSTCPITMAPLSNNIFRPNSILRKSIEEWKERNIIIRISSIKTILISGDDEEMIRTLGYLQELCEEKELYREYVVLESCLKVLVGLLGRSNRLIRNFALLILTILAKDGDGVKGLIAEVDNAIELIVRSLARRSEERKSAVALLLELSKCSMVRDRLGSIHGCILLLVTISNSDNNQASCDARELLLSLSSIDENVVQMAKASYFKPLLQRLGSGSDDVKMIMVRTLAEVELTDHIKANLFREGALDPLLHLILHGDADMKTMAVKALQSLSSLQQNSLQMVQGGAVRPLLDLLHLQVSSSSALQEMLAVIIMNIATSVSTVKNNEPLVFLKSDDDISSLFSLIVLADPNIQRCILQTFCILGQLPSANDVRTKLRQFSAIRVLIPLCDHTDLVLRANAVKLLSCLMEGHDNSTLQADADQKFMEALLSIIETSNNDEEVAAAMGIISKLPAGCEKFTRWLLDADALASIIKFLWNVRIDGSFKNLTVENAVAALCFFTVSTNPESQKRAAEAGVIPVLVQLLSSGTALTKKHAAVSLAQLSESSLSLSRPIEKQNFFSCCSGPLEIGCKVHLGICSMETSFCLLEADAVNPLVRLLEDADTGVCEAALKALSTLMECEMLQNGSRVISESGGIGPIIRLLSSQEIDLQEKALRVLERIFQLEEHRKMYGAYAQMPLVDIAQRANGSIRALAARALAHLDVLHDQSTYF